MACSFLVSGINHIVHQVSRERVKRVLQAINVKGARQRSRVCQRRKIANVIIVAVREEYMAKVSGCRHRVRLDHL